MDVTRRDEYSAAINQDLGRQVNERIHERAHKGDKIPLLCECADPDCKEVVLLSNEQYRSVRQENSCFVVANGHVLPKVERVVSRQKEWSVVEKTGKAGQLAEQLIPPTPRAG